MKHCRTLVLPPNWKRGGYTNLQDEHIRQLSRHCKVIAPGNFYENSKNVLILPHPYYVQVPGKALSAAPRDAVNTAIRIFKDVFKPLYVMFKIAYYFFMFFAFGCGRLWYFFSDFWECNFLALLLEKLGYPVYLDLVTYLDIENAKGDSFVDKKRKKLMRSVLAGCAIAFAPTDGAFKQYSPLVPPTSMKLRNNAISNAKASAESKASARKKLGIPPGAAVLCVARFDRFKCLENLVSLARKSPRLKFILAAGEYDAKYKGEILKSAPANLQVKLNVPPEIVPIYMRACDCLVQTSDIDNYNATLLEGFVNGIPVASKPAGIAGSSVKDYVYFSEDLGNAVKRAISGGPRLPTEKAIKLFTLQKVIPKMWEEAMNHETGRK